MKAYILRDEQLIETDVDTWARCYEDPQARIVAKTTTSGVEVSTVLLGIDHNFGGGGPPVLFETMIFGAEGPGELQWRWHTLEEARQGHAKIVALLETGWKPEEIE